MNELFLLGTHLQTKGYFTLYEAGEGYPSSLDVCKPNEDVSVEEVREIASEVTNVKFNIVDVVGGHDRCWNNYVRVYYE